MPPLPLTPAEQALVRDVAQIIAVPKVEPASSFVLHAPLELLARALLLPHVRPDSRAAAATRVRELGRLYSESGQSVAGPPVDGDGSTPELSVRLVAAIGAGDLDEVDRLALALGRQATPAELRHFLAGPMVTSLAAAGHASILFSLLPRVPWATPELLRGTARELARHPDWHLTWFEDRPMGEGGASLFEVLLDVPVLGVPGSTFIYPVMGQAETSGVAAKVLTGVATDVAGAGRDLGRVAAWSMLQEGPEHAPYGWTHCLTMPQAVMALAGDGVDPSVAAAVAATYVVGFRSALGTALLVPRYAPPSAGTGGDLAMALAEGPEAAAAAAWHAADRGDLRTELATRAALHHDAHLVKYTLACFDAAAADPESEQVYLAAAGSLGGWWAQHPED